MEPDAIPDKHVKGYKYGTRIIAIALCLYACVHNLGSRGVVRILEVFNKAYGGHLFKDIPSHQTVEDWAEKAGLNELINAHTVFDGKKYAEIIDESIFINKQKVLLELAVEDKTYDRPLKLSDVHVIGMSISPSWASDNVKAQLDITASKTSGTRSYIVSDQGWNLKAAARDAGIMHHYDISHSFGIILKSAYGKDPDFVAYTKLLEKKRLEYHLTDMAYLLPPKQRAIARFMNCFDWVEWSHEMLERYNTLNGKEKDAYSFICEYKGLIEEMYQLMGYFRKALAECKNSGLTSALAEKYMRSSMDEIVMPLGTSRRMQSAGLGICSYFHREHKLLLESNDYSHIISSDIIESGFGVFKGESSPNKLQGVTGHALLFPLSLKFSDDEEWKHFDFKQCMENTRFADVKDWKNLNLLDNMVVKRNEILKKAS